LFLDVQMPGLDGFEVVEALSPEVMPLIVFVTAYDVYALKAFEANAVAYLLKPVVEEKLQSVVGRIEQLAGPAADAARAAVRATAVGSATHRPLHHVLAIQKQGYLLIPVNVVCYFQVEDGVTYVKSATASYRTNYAIGDLEVRLPSPSFFRAHRATIANLDMVATIHPMFKGALMLKMRDSQGSEIQVSERQAKHVRELLQI
jgi:DNA-binding LytR/AlgR family response regulator